MINIRLSTSPRGLATIVREEAIVLATYDDNGRIANGIGNNEATLVPGSTITIEEAFLKFKENMVRFDKVVNDVVTRGLKQNEFDALTSRAFNKGVAGFKGMTELIRLVNENDPLGVAKELISPANTRRRLHEALIYACDEYRDTKIVPLYRGDPRLPTTKREWIPMPMKLLQWN